ncbi:MAG: hypothetical protein WCP52_01075 [Bacteroidota bacterium]
MKTRKIILTISIALSFHLSSNAQGKRNELPFDTVKNKVAWVGEIAINGGISKKEAMINIVQWAYKNSFKIETENDEAGILVLVASIMYGNHKVVESSEKLRKAPFKIFFVFSDKSISYRITDMSVSKYPIEIRYEYYKKRPAMGYHYAFIDINKRINELIVDFTKVNNK